MTNSGAHSGDRQQQLSELDEEIARLRDDRDGIKEELGDGAGPRDAEETAAAVTNLEETEALLAALENRRTSLLGDDSGEK